MKCIGSTKWLVISDGTRAYVADHMKDYPNACERIQRCATDGRETVYENYFFAYAIVIYLVNDFSLNIHKSLISNELDVKNMRKRMFIDHHTLDDIICR